MHPRLLAAAAVIALVALPLAACADDDDTTTTPDPAPGADDATDRIREAATATLEEGTAAFTIVVDHEGDGSAARDDTGTDTRSETDPEDTAITVGTLDVEGEVEFDDEQRQMTVSSTDDGVEVVVDGTTAYVERSAADDEWTNVEIEDLVENDPRAAAALADPTAVLRLLQDDVIDAVQDGTGQVDGTNAVDRYTVTVDVNGATVDDPALQELLDSVDNDDLQLSVWMDGDQRIETVELELEVDSNGTGTDTDSTAGGGDAHAGTEGPLVMTLELSELGEDVTIELPSEDSIVESDTQAVKGSLGLAATGTSGPDTNGTNGPAGAGDTADTGTGTGS